jgi:uncharacterized RDD family membrane protein YckC
MSFDSRDIVEKSPIQQDNTHVKYAGFWIRQASGIIDLVIIMVPLVIVFSLIIVFFMFAFIRSNSTGAVRSAVFGSAITCLICMMYLVVFIIVWLYFAWFESSKYMGTPGKILLGLKVTDLNGNRISGGKASLRFICKTILDIFFYTGSIFITISEKKQGLYDIIAGTLVVKRK